MEKRTTIFSIFVFLCLLTNSTYARTTEYEIQEIPYWTWCSILTWRPDRRTRITKETVKRWQHWIPCLPILPAADIFIPLFWFHRIHITEKRTGHSAGPKKKRGSKSVLMSEISASQCRPNLYPYRRRIRGCLTETDNGRQAGPRPGGCIGIDRLSPWQSCKNARFLATSGCRHTLSIYFQPAATGAQTDKNKSLPVLSGRKGRKNSSTEQAAMIEETEFIPIDRETTIAPMAVQALPQKERRQVITETEKQ